MDTPESTDKSQQARMALLAFVLPFVVYMILQAFEPTPPPTAAAPAPAATEIGAAPVETTPDDGPLGDVVDDDVLEAEDFSEESGAPSSFLGIEIPETYYPIVYTVKVAITFGVLAFFLPVYLRHFPLKVSPLAFVVGVVGVLLWIGCCRLNLEGYLVDWLGPGSKIVEWLGLGPRASYNPLTALEDQGAWKYAFLAVRFFGLALLVPVIEEAFLRAFLARYVMHDSWLEIPFGVVNRVAVATVILVPALYHPEKVASLVWFGLVTWLMVRTKNFWDCVVAHSVTNLLLGIYVVVWGEWQLW